MYESRPDFYKPPPFNVAVFADTPDGGQILLIRLDAASEGAASDAIARGLHYAGSISVNDGEPKVQIENGFCGVIALAGLRFAEALGEHCKAHQLRLLSELKQPEK